MGTPPGGPEDKSGPFLVSYFPEANAINAPRRMVARLQFSEPVNRTSVEAALFLSPDPMQRLHYRWRGQELELIYLDELERDRTYVISIGNQAKDLRGNPAGQTFTIAFSTGSRIDRGRIDGWVTEQDAPQGVSIWAYPHIAGSETDPSTTSPAYRMQPDATGHFELNYMRAGWYRVFAVLDHDHNGLWKPSEELIGIAPWDVNVTDTTVSWVSFKLANQDTAPPALRSVKEVHVSEVQIRTTAPVDTLTAMFVSQEGDTVRSLDQYTDLEQRDTWHIFPAKPLFAGKWMVVATGESRFRESWADTQALEIRARADTTRPKILYSNPPVRGRARTVLPDLTLEFAEPVVLDSAGLADAYIVSPSRDSIAIAIHQRASRIVQVLPDISWCSFFSRRCNGPERDRTSDFFDVNEAS